MMAEAEMVAHVQRKLLAASYTANGQDLKALFRRLDKKRGHGMPTLHDFGVIVQKMLPGEVPQHRLQKVLDIIDRDGDGAISIDDFEAFMDVDVEHVAQEHEQRHEVQRQRTASAAADAAAKRRTSIKSDAQQWVEQRRNTVEFRSAQMEFSNAMGQLRESHSTSATPSKATPKKEQLSPARARQLELERNWGARKVSDAGTSRTPPQRSPPKARPAKDVQETFTRLYSNATQAMDAKKQEKPLNAEYTFKPKVTGVKHNSTSINPYDMGDAASTSSGSTSDRLFKDAEKRQKALEIAQKVTES